MDGKPVFASSQNATSLPVKKTDTPFKILAFMTPSMIVAVKVQTAVPMTGGMAVRV